MRQQVHLRRAERRQGATVQHPKWLIVDCRIVTLRFAMEKMPEHTRIVLGMIA